jgi:hypothetical protein
VLHALTDSLWVELGETGLGETGLGETPGVDLPALCEQITRATKIEMSLEGIYNWIVFLPSKVEPNRPVAVRYYGVFDDGRLKLRGLACRRSDMPEFVKKAQREMLGVVAKARTLEERSGLIEQAELILKERIVELQQQLVDPQELLVKRTMTKDVDAYSVETRTAIAARQLKDAGVKTHAGERVRYLITNARAKERSTRVRAEEIEQGKGYDAEEYVKILKSAAAEIIYPQSVSTSLEFFSCFISYSSKDQRFAERLYDDLRKQEIRCWFAPEDLRIGERLRTGIDESIRRYDKLLLVLSKNSISSDWVEKEVETALERERSQKQVVLLPIRLDDTVMEIKSGWPADIRRARNIGDFRQWEMAAAYEKALARLLRDLKREKS